MLRTAAALAACTALFLPAAAHAGGWASVSLDPRPDGARTGEPWVVDLTVLQHGRTPLVGVEPAIRVTGPGGRERHFAAEPTARPGVYRARVDWPSPGRYTYEVDDGFGNAFPVRHPAVEVSEGSGPLPAAAGGVRPEPGFPWTLYLVSVAGLALMGLALALVLRDRGPQARKLPRTPTAGPATAPASSSRATSSRV